MVLGWVCACVVRIKGSAVWLVSVAQMASGAGCGFKILVWVCGSFNKIKILKFLFLAKSVAGAGVWLRIWSWLNLVWIL